MASPPKPRREPAVQEVRGSPLEEVRRLLSRLVARVRQRLAGDSAKGRYDVMDLEGLGAEVWRSIDVDAYLKGERDSWVS